MSEEKLNKQEQEKALLYWVGAVKTENRKLCEAKKVIYKKIRKLKDELISLRKANTVIKQDIKRLKERNEKLQKKCGDLWNDASNWRTIKKLILKGE